MPTYNGERYVREAVESVLDNGYSDLELVVLDDCSTDATVAVVEAIRHPAVRLSRNPRNLGVVETRRRGVPLLRGRYVALLDQDDLAVAGRFAAQLARLESAGGPDIIGGAIENFGDLGGIKQFYASDAEIRASLLFNASIANPAACMKTAPLREGLLEYSLAAGPAADYALWVDAMLAGLRLENLATVVTRYRRARRLDDADRLRRNDRLCRRRAQARRRNLFPAMVRCRTRRAGQRHLGQQRVPAALARRHFRHVARGAGGGQDYRHRPRADGRACCRSTRCG